MGIPERFDQKLPSQLAGFGPAFVVDLRDLVACYGAEVRRIEGLRRLNLPTPLPCQVTVTVPPSRMGNVSLRPYPFDGDVSRFIILVLDDEARSYVQWDMRVTAAQVRDAMAVVDAEMAHCRDPVTGRRRSVACDTYAPPQLRVDRVFARKDLAFVPKEIDPEAMRLQFDRPDDLAIVPDADGRGTPGLRRVRKAGSDARRDEVTARVLAKYGVRDQADIDGMSRARLQAMLAEIEADLDSDGN